MERGRYKTYSLEPGTGREHPPKFAQATSRLCVPNLKPVIARCAVHARSCGMCGPRASSLQRGDIMAHQDAQKHLHNCECALRWTAHRPAHAGLTR